MIQSLCDVNEKTMIAAHQSGMDYFKRNPTALLSRSVARSLGWHGELEECWVAGFAGARRRQWRATYLDDNAGLDGERGSADLSDVIYP